MFDAYTFSSGRILASSAVLMALIGAVLGGRSLARSRGIGRGGAIAALVLGPIGIVVGGFVVATASGGVGTGNGVGGGVVAMILGFISVALGSLTLIRSQPSLQ